jgi:hypothetical protein
MSVSVIDLLVSTVCGSPGAVRITCGLAADPASSSRRVPSLLTQGFAVNRMQNRVATVHCGWVRRGPSALSPRRLRGRLFSVHQGEAEESSCLVHAERAVEALARVAGQHHVRA